MATVKKEFVYEEANDQHSRALLVYGKSADTKLYYDAAYTEQVTVDDAVKFFAMSSLVIDVGGVLYTPFSVNKTTNKVLTVTKSSTSLNGTEWAVAANA